MLKLHWRCCCRDNDDEKLVLAPVMNKLIPPEPVETNLVRPSVEDPAYNKVKMAMGELQRDREIIQVVLRRYKKRNGKIQTFWFQLIINSKSTIVNHEILIRDQIKIETIQLQEKEMHNMEKRLWEVEEILY